MEKTTAVVQISPQRDLAVIQLLNEVTAIAERAEGFVVQQESDVLLATNDLSLIARLKKVMGDKRKEYLQPLKTHIDSINAAFKVIAEPLALADSTMRGKVLAYRNEQERKKREAEEIERQKRELAEREAKLKGEPAPVQPPVPTIHLQPRAGAEEGETNVSKIWVWEMEDFAKVNDFYKKLDNGKVSAAVKSGKGNCQIEGIRIYQKPTLRVEAEK